MVSCWSFSDNRFPQISWTLLSILANLKKSCSLDDLHSSSYSKFSSFYNTPLVTVLRAPVSIGNTIIFIFHSFFQFPCQVLVLILLFTFFFDLALWRPRTSKSTIRRFFIFLLNIMKSCRGSVCILKSERSLCVSFSRTG